MSDQMAPEETSNTFGNANLHVASTHTHTHAGLKILDSTEDPMGPPGSSPLSLPQQQIGVHRNDPATPRHRGHSVDTNCTFKERKNYDLNIAIS